MELQFGLESLNMSSFKDESNIMLKHKDSNRSISSIGASEAMSRKIDNNNNNKESQLPLVGQDQNLQGA